MFFICSFNFFFKNPLKIQIYKNFVKIQIPEIR